MVAKILFILLIVAIITLIVFLIIETQKDDCNGPTVAGLALSSLILMFIQAKFIVPHLVGSWKLFNGFGYKTKRPTDKPKDKLQTSEITINTNEEKIEEPIIEEPIIEQKPIVEQKPIEINVAEVQTDTTLVEPTKPEEENKPDPMMVLPKSNKSQTTEDDYEDQNFDDDNVDNYYNSRNDRRFQNIYSNSINNQVELLQQQLNHQNAMMQLNMIKQQLGNQQPIMLGKSQQNNIRRPRSNAA